MLEGAFVFEQENIKKLDDKSSIFSHFIRNKFIILTFAPLNRY
jgi:hypothetical protein